MFIVMGSFPLPVDVSRQYMILFFFMANTAHEKSNQITLTAEAENHQFDPAYLPLDEDQEDQGDPGMTKIFPGR